MLLMILLALMLLLLLVIPLVMLLLLLLVIPLMMLLLLIDNDATGADDAIVGEGIETADTEITAAAGNAINTTGSVDCDGIDITKSIDSGVEADAFVFDVLLMHIFLYCYCYSTVFW